MFAWIAHRLRLLGRVSGAQAAKAFGVNARQFRRWIDEYNNQASQKGNPEAVSLKGPRTDPLFAAAGLTPEEIDQASSLVRGEGDVFPVSSGLIPSTSEALALLDAWRAHAILAHVAPNAYKDPAFLDGNGDPIVVEAGGAIHPRLDGEIIPVLLQAINMKCSIEMDYINKKGHRERRVFSPHRFIFSQGRYHVRGYDYLRKRCLDLNPARAFSAQMQPPDAPYLGPEVDSEWNQTVKLSFSLVKLAIDSPAHMATIRQTFPILENGTLSITARKPLAYYIRIQILSYALRTDNGVAFPAFYEKS